MIHRLFALVAWLAAAAAAEARPAHFVIAADGAAFDTPVLVDAARLPALIGRPADELALVARRGEWLEAIPFQIDPRDAEGRYLYGDAVHDRVAPEDECVFMRGDTGPRARADDPLLAGALAEIELRAPGDTRYAYVIAALLPTPRDDVRYRDAAHAVETAAYRLAFAPGRPMQIVSLQWAGDGGFGPDLVDVMKLRHTGRFFGAMFTRSEADYRSRLAGVRDGPVRVLRRTVNHVRVFGPFESPAVTVDLIAYARAFVAEVSVVLPFRIGWVFDDLSTRLTLDGSAHTPWHHRLHLDETAPGLSLDGHPSPAKAAFTGVAREGFLLASEAGVIAAGILLEDDTPLSARVFLADDLATPDPPETEPGQFGHLGFSVLGWERLDRRLHRMRFYAVMLPRTGAEEGFRLAAAWRSGMLKSGAGAPP